MRLHALNSVVKEENGWTELRRRMPGDSAITRGDQIRKRNIYCRQRTRLSSFNEIIRPEKRERERERERGERKRRGIICMVPEKHIPSSVGQKIRIAVVQN